MPLRFDRGRREEVPIDGFTDAMTQNYGEDLGGKPERWHKIKGGSDLLPKAFAEKLAGKIQYGAAVVKIEQDANQARVVFVNDGRQQTFTADKVICTIPFSVLRNIELPAIVGAQEGAHKKHSLRCCFTRLPANEESLLGRKRTQWFCVHEWRDRDLAADVESTWTTRDLDDLRKAGRSRTNHEIEREGSHRFDAETVGWDLFRASRKLRDVGVTKCWMEDEWSRGAWAFVGLTDFFTASAPEGRIHFAGEHLSPWFSWIQGALSSGLRVVKEIEQSAPV